MRSFAYLIRLKYKRSVEDALALQHILPFKARQTLAAPAQKLLIACVLRGRGHRIISAGLTAILLRLEFFSRLRRIFLLPALFRTHSLTLFLAVSSALFVSAKCFAASLMLLPLNV